MECAVRRKEPISSTSTSKLTLNSLPKAPTEAPSDAIWKLNPPAQTSSVPSEKNVHSENNLYPPIQTFDHNPPPKQFTVPAPPAQYEAPPSFNPETSTQLYPEFTSPSLPQYQHPAVTYIPPTTQIHTPVNEYSSSLSEMRQIQNSEKIELLTERQSRINEYLLQCDENMIKCQSKIENLVKSQVPDLSPAIMEVRDDQISIRQRLANVERVAQDIQSLISSLVSADDKIPKEQEKTGFRWPWESTKNKNRAKIISTRYELQCQSCGSKLAISRSSLRRNKDNTHFVFYCESRPKGCGQRNELGSLINAKEIKVHNK